MKKNILTYVENRNLMPRMLVLCFGAFIAALIYNSYTVPNNLVYGGMSGLSIVLNSIYELSPVIYMNILSITTLVLGIIFLGFKEASYGIVGYLIYTLMINITAPVAQYITLDFDSRLLNTLFFATANGITFGFIYRTGFNTAGTDTIIEILKKFFHKPIGHLGIIVNGIIIASGLYIFGVTNAIYAVTFMIIHNKVCDFVLIGSRMHKLCYIQSREQNAILDYIEDTLNCGYTILDSTNGIGFLNRKIILCVIPSDRFFEFKNTILKLDKKAKVVSNDCYTVEGGTIDSLLLV